MDEFKVQLDFLITQLHRECHNLPKDKFDVMRRGKVEAYSHCYVELLNLRKLLPE